MLSMQAGTKVKKPSSDLYHPFFQKYIDQISEDYGLLKYYEDQKSDFLKFANTNLRGIENYSYGEGKWTVKEVIGHCIDVERIMSFRLLSFARGEKASLPGFSEDDYVANSSFNEIEFDSLIQEFDSVRVSTISLIGHLREEKFDVVGICNDTKTSVSALAYMIPGHLSHHITILKERYL